MSDLCNNYGQGDAGLPCNAVDYVPESIGQHAGSIPAGMGHQNWNRSRPFASPFLQTQRTLAAGAVADTAADIAAVATGASTAAAAPQGGTSAATVTRAVTPSSSTWRDPLAETVSAGPTSADTAADIAEAATGASTAAAASKGFTYLQTTAAQGRQQVRQQLSYTSNPAATVTRAVSPPSSTWRDLLVATVVSPNLRQTRSPRGSLTLPRGGCFTPGGTVAIPVNRSRTPSVGPPQRSQVVTNTASLRCPVERSAKAAHHVMPHTTRALSRTVQPIAKGNTIESV